LGLLKITEEYVLDENRTTEPASSKEMLIVLTLAVYNKIAQTIMLKSMVPDLGWFDGDWANFED